MFFRHRKIYVILDGSAVLNLNVVPGKFIDIPTLRFMEEVKSKKERVSILYKFIESCRDAFGLNVKIKNIYDYKGRPIYDLAHIPEESKFIYVSTNEIFVGISIINYSENTDKIMQKRLLNAFEIRDKTEKIYSSEIKHNFFNDLEKTNRQKIKNIDHKINVVKENTKKRINAFIPPDDYFYESKFFSKERDYSFDCGHYISKKYLEDEKINLKNNFEQILQEEQNNKNRKKIIFNKYDSINSNNKHNHNIKIQAKNSLNNFHKKEFYHRINYVLSERYFSDDNKNKQKANEYLIQNFSDSYKLWIHFLDFLTEKNKYFLKNKITTTFQKLKEKEKKNKSFLERLEEEEKRSKLFSCSQKENNKNNNSSYNNNQYDLEQKEHFEQNNHQNIEDDIINLIDKFNKNIDKKINSLENYINKKKSKKNLLRPDCPDKLTLKLKKEMVARTKLLMKNFILGFQLFGSAKQKSGDYMLDKHEDKKDLKYLIQNKKSVENIYYDLEKRVNRTLPTLFSFNIPKILEKYKNFSREELYELFVQYKVIMKISIALKKDRKLANKGIDFTAFYKGVPQMSNESNELAYKIFDVINESKSNHLSLDEFLRGMSVIKSEEISDKIDMFFKIIDSDGNGQLSWDEVYQISLMSLKRSLVVEDEKGEELIKELAEYFADLIFKLVEIDKDEEIPLPKIREKIDQGGEEGKYLEMLCCADNFKK